MASQYDLPYTGQQVETLLAKISELESEMPSKTSDLTNDSGFITSADVPTKTSDLNNDSGFITNAPVAAEAARAQAAEALLATISSLQAEITRATGVEGTLQNLIDGIAAKIPSAATEQNQLADKAFVNSSIATATAEFRGTYDSLAELQAVSADENDYGYVRTTDAAGNTIFKRYKYASGIWVFEYDLNNSSFTASQWAAINSAITAELVEKLRALPTNAALTELLNGKQGVIPDLDTIRSNAAKGGTAYQKPAGGIPKSDMSPEVQSSLGNADSAVQESAIADNLTTDDAKKVLSAKQGAVLAGRVSQLAQEVDADISQLRQEIYSDVETVVPFADYVSGYIAQSGNIASKGYTTLRVSVFPCKNGDIFKVRCTLYNATSARVYAVYTTAVKEDISAANCVMVGPVGEAGGEYTVLISDENAKLFAVQYHYTSEANPNTWGISVFSVTKVLKTDVLDEKIDTAVESIDEGNAAAMIASKDWRVIGNVTYDSNEIPISYNITWADGTAGTVAMSGFNDDVFEYSIITATYKDKTIVYTISYDSNGYVTNENINIQ